MKKSEYQALIAACLVLATSLAPTTIPPVLPGPATTPPILPAAPAPMSQELPEVGSMAPLSSESATTLQTVPETPDPRIRIRSNPVRISLPSSSSSSSSKATTSSSSLRAVSTPVTEIRGRFSPVELAELQSLRFHGKSIRELKILLVDDNMIIQKTAARLFPASFKISAENFTTSVAVNGELAVKAVRDALLENKPYDLILMDENMPVSSGSGFVEKNGIVTTREIRELEQALKNQAPDALFKHVHIIGNSMSDPPEKIRQEFMQAGASGYCYKDQLDTEYFKRLLTALKEIADHVAPDGASATQ
jgi:CheY-like chemotaxis protein